MAIVGGLLIYGTIISFTMFFQEEQEFQLRLVEHSLEAEGRQEMLWFLDEVRLVAQQHGWAFVHCFWQKSAWKFKHLGIFFRLGICTIIQRRHTCIMFPAFIVFAGFKFKLYDYRVISLSPIAPKACFKKAAQNVLGVVFFIFVPYMRNYRQA